MDKGLKEFIKEKSGKQASILVGKLCSQIEAMLEDDSLSDETRRYLRLCKALRKELIYQEFRSLQYAIIFYLEGREYQKFPIFSPKSDTKSD